MTAVRYCTVRCDACRAEYTGRGSRMRVVRTAAARAGWAWGWNANRTRADFCPACHRDGKGTRSEEAIEHDTILEQVALAARLAPIRPWWEFPATDPAPRHHIDAVGQWITTLGLDTHGILTALTVTRADGTDCLQFTAVTYDPEGGYRDTTQRAIPLTDFPPRIQALGRTQGHPDPPTQP